jgi:hypothetical protein
VNGNDYNMTLTRASEAAAKCPVSLNKTSIEDGRMALVAVHLLFEIAKPILTLDYMETLLDITTALDDYDTCFFTMPYYTALSSKMELMFVDAANGKWRQASPMARDVIEKRKMYA